LAYKDSSYAFGTGFSPSRPNLVTRAVSARKSVLRRSVAEGAGGGADGGDGRGRPIVPQTRGRRRAARHSESPGPAGFGSREFCTAASSTGRRGACRGAHRGRRGGHHSWGRHRFSRRHPNINFTLAGRQRPCSGDSRNPYSVHGLFEPRRRTRRPDGQPALLGPREEGVQVHTDDSDSPDISAPDARRGPSPPPVELAGLIFVEAAARDENHALLGDRLLSLEPRAPARGANVYR
jgi:hypothetical protein